MKAALYIRDHNSLEQVILALGVGAAALLALLFVRRILSARLHARAVQSTAIWDDVLAEVVGSTKLPFLLWISVMAGLTQIELPPSGEALPYKAMMLLLILQAGIWASRGVATWIRKRLEHSTQAGDGAAVTNFGVIAFITRLAIWVIVLLLLLDNLGVNITTLVASLGIGGVAVALALQNVLGDLFASLSIAIDKPFVVGDFIIVDDYMGTVKHVGLKTTRIQSLSGEELIFSNNDLLKSRIRNYKRMNERRIVFSFGVTYDTPADKLEALPGEVRAIVGAQDGTRFDRAHFRGFGASSLDFEVVYFTLDPDFNKYMDTQQRINLTLIRHLQSKDIALALPTQTLRVLGNAPPPLGERAAAPQIAPG
ncbi:MAG: mechanosensitive ion channel family protein [Moraxellaceae bacterium]|nr:mechanosensitive ion channel family protein [Moraxellaceae bacterium]